MQQHGKAVLAEGKLRTRDAFHHTCTPNRSLIATGVRESGITVLRAVEVQNVHLGMQRGHPSEGR